MITFRRYLRLRGGHEHAKGSYWKDYLRDADIDVSDSLADQIMDLKTDAEKLQFLEKEGISKKTIEALGTIGISKEIQEYIIKKRPDLIGEIWDLNPELAKKHSHEKELGNVDL